MNISLVPPFAVACSDDRDCNLNTTSTKLACYQNVPWSPLPSFCDCYTTYGFTGPTCTDLSAQTYFSILVASLFMLISLVVCIDVVVVLFKSIKRHRATQEFMRRFKVTVITFVLDVVSIISFGIYGCFFLLDLLDPAGLIDLFDRNVGFYKTGKRTLIWGTALAFPAFVASYCSLFVSVSWLEIVNKVLQLEKAGGLKSFRVIGVCIGVVAVIYTLVGAFLLLDSRLRDARVLTSVVAFFTLAVYIVGKIAFRSVADAYRYHAAVVALKAEAKQDVGNEDFVNDIEVVVYYSNLILITLFLFAGSMAWIAVIYNDEKVRGTDKHKRNVNTRLRRRLTLKRVGIIAQRRLVHLDGVA